MSDGFKLENADATIAKLERFSGSVRRKIIRRGVAAGGAVQLKAARAAAPRGKTGLMKRSLAQVNKSYASRGVFMSIVGQQRNKHFSDKAKGLAKKRTGGLSGGISGSGRVVPIHLVNDPTRRHVIRRSSADRQAGKSLAFRSGGGIRFARSVNHPGTRGTRFMQQAERSSRNAAESAMTTKIQQGTNAEAAKL